MDYYEGKYGLTKKTFEVVKIKFWSSDLGPNQQIYFKVNDELELKSKKDFLMFSDDKRFLENLAKIYKD